MRKMRAFYLCTVLVSAFAGIVLFKAPAHQMLDVFKVYTAAQAFMTVCFFGGNSVEHLAEGRKIIAPQGGNP